MKNIIQFIVIATLVSITFLGINAQEQTLVKTTEGSTATEKVEKKNESAEKRQSNSDDDSWRGFYVGGYVGNSNGRATPQISIAFDPNGFYNDFSLSRRNKAGIQKIQSNGLNGGGTVGYNIQKGHFFIGGEADFGGQKIDKTVTGTFPFADNINNLPFTFKQSIKSNWMLTARPRAGVAFKKVIVYATGGIAITNLKYAGTFTETFSSVVEKGSFSKVKTGWTAGAGIEFKVARRWSVKGDYLFSQFGRVSAISNDFQAQQFNDTTINVFTHSTDLKSHSIRFGINYRF